MLGDLLIHEYMNNREYFLISISRTDNEELKTLQNMVYTEYSKYPHISIGRSILKNIYRVLGENIYG